MLNITNSQIHKFPYSSFTHAKLCLLNDANPRNHMESYVPVNSYAPMEGGTEGIGTTREGVRNPRGEQLASWAIEHGLAMSSRVPQHARTIWTNDHHHVQRGQMHILPRLSKINKAGSFRQKMKDNALKWLLLNSIGLGPIRIDVN